VPFPAGGSLDVVARAIGQKLTDAWGQPVIIDNRPGAAATSAPTSSPECARRLHHPRGALSTHAVNVTLYGAPYDPIKDFGPSRWWR
jgi:tripartite-type tricarboxylate transporter receptor subunit TctC